MSGAQPGSDVAAAVLRAQALIAVSGVTRILPGAVPVTLVHDIDLTIGGNEFVAITGPSGSGKSSLLYLLGLGRTLDIDIIAAARDKLALIREKYPIEKTKGRATK